MWTVCGKMVDYLLKSYGLAQNNHASKLDCWNEVLKLPYSGYTDSFTEMAVHFILSSLSIGKYHLLSFTNLFHLVIPCQGLELQNIYSYDFYPFNCYNLLLSYLGPLIWFILHTCFHINFYHQKFHGIIVLKLGRRWLLQLGSGTYISAVQIRPHACRP